MGRKNKKRPRKRKRLTADPKRQATDSLRGYRYQILHSVNAWLDLDEGETLYLEGVEDFDIVSDDTATVVQVKDTQHNITLKSQEVIKAINHYWEARTNHPYLTVKFRFITRSKIGKEQGNPFGNNQQGLRLWSRCSRDEEIITKISEFLRTQKKISDEVRSFLEQADLQRIHEQLIEPITWETGSPNASSVEKSISDKLILHGDRYPIPISPPDAKKVLDHLHEEALRVATQTENRKLTKVRFLEIFYQNTTQNIPNWYLQRLQMLETQAAALDTASTVLIGDSPDVAIQLHSPIQTVIPPLYPNVAPRTDLLTSIQTKLQSDNMVVIHGGVDRGKTTLAKLAANVIDGAWFWLNLREKDPAQVIQLLQQLAIKINNQSSQINVVLDDLNLQFQWLQAYEEILGMVIYSLQARGAKLLITSQHKPPNSFIRNLGLSSPIVVHVPNLTLPEIEQFAEQMGCPSNDVETWAKSIQEHTTGHPRLVSARLTRLREEGWQQQDTIETISKIPPEIVEEREAARQLLMNLPKNHKEFLYRLSLLTEFRKDYAINIGEIPKSIAYPGDAFSQLVGPWIDPVNEIYYTISPLLTNAAKEVWSENKRKYLHAHIASEILNTKELSTIEARAIFLHSVRGRNKESLITIIVAMLTASENNWKELCQEFSGLIHVKADLPEELFPGDALVNHYIRFLQYRIAARVEPEFAPNILEIWDEETKLYEPHQSYPHARLMLATEVLRYNQVSLPVKQLVGYLKEMIDIKNRDKEGWEIYLNSMREVEEHITDKSNFFSFLFSFVYTRSPLYAPFLNDLIEALDELDPKDRTLLLADFGGDNIESQLLIDGVLLSEAQIDSPDWIRCLQVFDKVIEKTIEWDYLHLAAASARGRAIIHDVYLHDPDTAQKSLQDAVSKIGLFSAIEETQAVLYFNQKCYKESLDIHEHLLSKPKPPLEKSDIRVLEGYRQAAICAAFLEDWIKAATFFVKASQISKNLDDPKSDIGLSADAGFAQFKAGNMLDGIKLLNQALQKFDTLPQDNTDVKYFTLKKRLVYSIGWIAKYILEDYTSESEETLVGVCSNPYINAKVLTLPDSSIEYAWLCLAKMEYQFGHETTALEHALQITDRDAYPGLRGNLYFLKIRYDFKNKTFDNLPQHIYQLANMCGLMQEHNQGRRRIGNEEINALPVPDLSNSVDVGTLTIMLVAALLTQVSRNRDVYEILSIWRANSSELPKKENLITVLDLIEAMLSGDQNNALTVMSTQETIPGEWLVAALKVVQNKETTPEDLLYGHIFITMFFIGQTSEDFVVSDLAKLLSVQWLEKIRSGTISQTPVNIIQQITQACKSNETGRKKIGQILLAVSQAVPIKVLSTTEVLQEFRSWIESKPKQK